MLQSHAREKLLHAIIYFAHNTAYCGKVKLFKLLYFLDFQHFMEVGRSVTSSDYYAWKMGPVPRDLHEELDAPQADMAKAMNVGESAPWKGGNKMLRIDPLIDFDSDLFSKREKRIMADLALEYRSARAEDMIEKTHLENLPWHRVWHDEGRKQALIPYDYALRKGEKTQAAETAREHEEIERNYM